MKKIVLLAWSLVAVATAHAQDKIEATISGDFVSSYIWRGLMPEVQQFSLRSVWDIKA